MIVREWGGADAPSQDFHLAIGVLGYESRATWLLRSRLIRADRYLGLRFGYHEALHFEEAKALYERLRADIILLEIEPIEVLREYLSRCAQEFGSELKIVVDVSAMSRLLMAELLVALKTCEGVDRCTLYAHYTPAEYKPGHEAVPVRIAQPVIPELAGWSSRPDAPLAVIAGLGYEAGAAAGALQYLEPSKAWVFGPVGPDSRFAPDVKRANSNLSGLFDIVSQTYDLTRSVETRGKMASLAAELSPDYRIAFVPLGPKLFAWLCTLTALEPEFSEASVWRFSAQELGEPVERTASGISIWHAVEFMPSRDRV